MIPTLSMVGIVLLAIGGFGLASSLNAQAPPSGPVVRLGSYVLLVVGAALFVAGVAA